MALGGWFEIRGHFPDHTLLYVTGTVRQRERGRPAAHANEDHTMVIQTNPVDATATPDALDHPIQGQTRDAVREAAFRLFGRHGYDGVSIDTIARAVRLSKGALYWHFEGKEALFRECLEMLEGLFREHVIAPMEESTTARERLDRFFRGVGTLAADTRIAEGIAGYWQEPCNEGLSRCFRERLGALEETLRQLLEQSLTEAGARGDLAPVADPRTSSETLMALMEAMLLPLRRRSPACRDALIDDLRGTVLRAYTQG